MTHTCINTRIHDSHTRFAYTIRIPKVVQASSGVHVNTWFYMNPVYFESMTSNPTFQLKQQRKSSFQEFRQLAQCESHHSYMHTHTQRLHLYWLWNIASKWWNEIDTIYFWFVYDFVVGFEWTFRYLGWLARSNDHKFICFRNQRYRKIMDYKIKLDQIYTCIQYLMICFFFFSIS